MKLSSAVVLLAVSGASAYTTPSRASLRSLGQKSVAVPSPRRNAAGGSNLKMEGELVLPWCTVEVIRIEVWIGPLLGGAARYLPLLISSPTVNIIPLLHTRL